MNGYSKECLETFLKNQGQLFDEPVAETLQEAEEFLEDCMAVVVNSKKEVRRWLDESGMDVEGMSDEEYDHLKTVWNDVQETMSQGNVNATLSAN